MSKRHRVWSQSFRRSSRHSQSTRLRSAARSARTADRLDIELLEGRLLLANWSGDLVGNTVWPPAGETIADVQRITNDVRIPVGSTLTIQPGTIVKFDCCFFAGLLVEGTLSADGTAAQPIVFTSDRDDTAGGDTNGDGGNTTPFNGAWERIEFAATSTGSVMDNVSVRYGGDEGLGSVFVNGGQLTLTNSTLRNSVSSGLRIVAANPTVTTNVFSDNTGPAVSMDLASNPAISGVTVTNNGTNGLLLDGGPLVGNGFWNDPDIVYVMSNDVTVPASQTLTVAPGQVVKATCCFFVNLFVDGTLTADGTAGQPIIFTADRDDTAGGDTNNNAANDAPFNGLWEGIQFNATSTGSVMDFVDVRYGGDGPAPANVFVNGGQLTLTNSTIRNSAQAGVRIASSNPTLTSNTFVNNSGAAVSMDLASNPAISGVTLTNNGTNGLLLDGGPLVGNGFWNDPDIVYLMFDDVTVPAGQTLTVAPGQVVKARCCFFVNLFVDGTLTADGTAAQPIIFTADRDDAAGGDTNNNGSNDAPFNGLWEGIQFNATSTGSVMDFTDVRFGGDGPAPANIFVNGGQLTLTNSAVRNSAQAGVRIASSNPTLTNNSFVNNLGAAVRMDLASNPAITGVTMTNNGTNGLLLDGGSLVGNGFWNDPEIVYQMSDDVTVPAGQTLTIAPGQVVKATCCFFVNLFVDGTLVADGTVGQPIIFTGDRDDSAGGDTNNNGANDAPFNGMWEGIQFNGTSTASVLDFVDIRYGGDGPAPANIFVNGGQLTLTNSTIRNSAQAGVRIVSSNPTLTTNTFQNNAGAAVSMNLASNPAISGVTVTSNGTNGLLLDSGPLAGDAAWNDPDIVYVMTNDVTVPAGRTLTVAPGQVVKAVCCFFVDLVVDGTLIADGTAGQPIIFTADRDDTAGGDTNNNAGNDAPFNGVWRAIQLNPGSTGNVLDHVDIRYGGSGSAGELIVTAAPLVLTDSTVRNSASAGVRLVFAKPTMTGNTYTNNSGAAVSMDVGSNPAISGVTVSGNAVNGLAVDAGILYCHTVWNDPEIVYRLSGDLIVPECATLEIAAGQVVKFASGIGAELIVNGTLNAHGTPAQPVVFTSERDDTIGGDTNNNSSAGARGDWNSIQLSSTSTANVLDHVEVRFGGASSPGSVVATGAPLTVTNSLVRESSTHGIVARSNAAATVTNTVITKLSDTGIRVESGATVTATNNTIDGNFRGVGVDSATATLVNNLITNHSRSGVFAAGSATVTANSNDVFNPTASFGNYEGLANQTGTNGNISANPLYLDRPILDFGLASNSPAIDSATSTAAPTTDRFGNPRFDDPNMTNTGTGATTFFDRGAIERQTPSGVGRASPGDGNSDDEAGGPRGVPQRFGSVDGRAGVPLVVNDTDGTPVTFALKGPGVGEVFGGAALTRVVLTGTDAKSAVTITATGGTTVIGEIVVNGSLKSFIATPADVTGNVTITGTVGTLTLRDLVGGPHTISIGAAVGKSKGAALNLGRVAETSVNSQTPFKSILATEWLDTDATPDAIVGRSIGTLTINANFGADLTLSGVGVTGKKSALTSANITGTADNVAVRVTGNIGSFTAGRIIGSTIFAGFVAADAANPLRGGTFTLGQRITLVQTTSTGGAPSFESSVIAAANVQTVTLRTVATANGGRPFGVLARDSLSAVTAATTPAFRYVAANATPQGVGDFVVLRGPSAPVITGFATDSGTTGDRITNDTTLTVQGTAVANATVTVLINGASQGTTVAAANGAWSFTTLARPDGVQNITATARDANGNTSVASAVLAVTIDTQPPAAPAFDLDPASDTDPDGDGMTKLATVTLVGQTTAGAAVRLVETGATTTASGAGQFSFSGVTLTIGANGFTVQATDAAGNTSSTTKTITRSAELAEPVFTLNAATDTDPDGDLITAFASVTLNGATDANVSVRLVQTGATTTSNASGSFTFTGVPLALGENTLTARATDDANNMKEFTRTITRLDAPADGILLAERSNFVVEAMVPVTLATPAGSRELSFDVVAGFDATDTTAAIEDVLLVYLVDPSDPSTTLLDRGTPGTAIFSLAGGVAEMVPGLVAFDGTTVTIDVTSLAAETTGQLVFQLLNSDGDMGSYVGIGPVANVVDPNGVAGPVFPTAATPGTAGPALNLASLAASIDVDLNVMNVRFDSDAGRYTAELTVTNGGTAIGRRVAVVFPGLPAGVTLLNPSGIDGSGSPYISFGDSIASGGLGTGDDSEPIEVTFDNPSLTRFAIVPDILVGGPNQAPVLDAVGPLNVLPGGRLETPIDASDPDGDDVTLTIRTAPGAPALPTGMLDADGTLVFTPAPSEVGSYNFTLVASDGVLETTRPVTLNVTADPVTTTRVSGVIQRTNGQAIQGMQVEIGAVSGLTAADGSFTLDLGAGPPVGDTLKVRGELFAGPTVFPFIAEKLAFLLEHDVFVGANNVISRPIFLPAIDVANGEDIDPMQDATVTTPAIPGTELFVAAGTLMNQQGAPFDGVLSITEVPPDLTPAALPENLIPSLVVTIQPGEMVFAAPAPLSLPNTDGWAPGTMMDLWSISPVTGEFENVGTGKVSNDGSVIETMTGGVRNSSWHFFAPPAIDPVDPMNDPSNEDTACDTEPFT
jgi:hypothetical protein